MTFKRKNIYSVYTRYYCGRWHLPGS